MSPSNVGENGERIERTPRSRLMDDLRGHGSMTEIAEQLNVLNKFMRGILAGNFLSPGDSTEGALIVGIEQPDFSIKWDVLPAGSDGEVLTVQADGSLDWETAATSTEATGTIKMFGGAAAPAGFVLCDGSAINRITYAALFAVIGTTYGSGDGVNTFNVPDLRGRVPAGVGTGTGGGASGVGLPAGGAALTAIARGTWKGEETHVLTVAELAQHYHVIGIYGSGVGGNIAGSLNASPASVNSQNAGSNTAHNNIQPVMGVNFIIKT